MKLKIKDDLKFDPDTGMVEVEFSDGRSVIFPDGETFRVFVQAVRSDYASREINRRALDALANPRKGREIN